MAATLPTESEVTQESRRGRKQWSVQSGGPKGLLRRMRSQLAEDGCPDSQLVMGRTLLEQLGQEGAEGGAEEEEARLAVFWLTRASHQGSAEATQLLQRCLEDNIGICEHNYREVQDCLSMDLQEKLVRRAARLLFASISDGNEAVTFNRLVKKVQQVIRTHGEGLQEVKEEKPRGGTLEELYGGERFSEEHVISAAVLYHQGHIPPLHPLLSLPHTFAHTPAPHSTLARMVRWPLALFSNFYGSILHFFGVTLLQNGKRSVVACAPILCLAFVLCYVCGLRVLAFGRVLPTVVFCLAFGVMVISTALVLLDRRKLGCVRAWSMVFAHFCPELDVAAVERRFKWRCYSPYVFLCASVIMYVAATPLVTRTLVVASLPVMCVCGFLLFFFAVECVAPWHFVSLILYLIALRGDYVGLGASLKGVGASGWWVEGVDVEVWSGISLHLGISTALHLLWLTIQVCVGAIRGFTHLPPHLASLVWVHLAFVAAEEVTAPQDVVYPILAYLTLVVVPIFVSIGVVVLPVLPCVALHKLGAAEDTLVLAFILGACVTAIAQCLWPRLIRMVLRGIVLGAGVIVLLRPSAVLTYTPSQHSPLPWDSYKNVCVPSDTPNARIIHACSPLLGTAVRWRGSVLKTDVTQIRNIPQTVISYLPSFLEAPAWCYLGKQASDCPVKDDRCDVIRMALGPSGCSLDDWNEYDFEITVTMQSSYWKLKPDEVRLLADDAFTHFILGLREGDTVEFTATMVAGVGTGRLTLELSAIKCVSCKLAPVGVGVSRSVPPHTDGLWRAGRYVFNFFLAPTLTV